MYRYELSRAEACFGVKRTDFLPCFPYNKNAEMEARIVDSRRIIVYNWKRNESDQVPEFSG